MVLSDYEITFDADGNGAVNSADTLLALCKEFYGRDTDVNCKRLCGCP
jgi:hypothetical protein